MERTIGFLRSWTFSPQTVTRSLRGIGKDESGKQERRKISDGLFLLSYFPDSFHRFVFCDHAHGFREQLATGRNLVPRRCAARMRQWDEIECVAGALHDELAADHRIQFVERDELRDRELAHWNDEPRLKNLEFFI